MHKKKLSVWILGFVTLIICSFFYFRSSRFDISKEKGNTSYKIDRWTGDTWVLSGNREIKVENVEEESNQQITKAVAIEKVKKKRTLDYSYSNDFKIRSELENLKGNLKILGWDAKKVDGQTFLVSYKYQYRDQLKGFYFEFNTKADVIRNVLADADLQSKYNVGLYTPPTSKEIANVNIKKSIDQLIAEDKYEEAIKKISQTHSKSKSEIDSLEEKIYLNYGIFVEYQGRLGSSMDERMNSALTQYGKVLNINPNNKKAHSEIEQILKIYKSMPEKSPKGKILNNLRKLGFSYK